MSEDDTVLTEGHGTVEDTAPVVARRVAQTQSEVKFTVGRALPPQAPPVTDIHQLEFHPPEVPSGGVVRYKPRTDPEVRELPDWDASWQIRRRTPRELTASEVVAHQLDDRRAWKRRAILTVALISAAAIVVGGAGIWVLAHL